MLKKTKGKKKKPSRVKSAEDRRIHPRIPICARVRWPGQERYFFTRDLSVNGLFLFTDHPPPLSTLLDIELSIQYFKKPLELKGKVVRHEAENGRAVGCGVLFPQLHPKLNDLLKSFPKS